MRGRLVPARMRAASRACPTTLVDFDRFPLAGETHAVTTMGATPVPVHAIPFTRTDEDIDYLLRHIDAASKLGDPHAEGALAFLSWLRGQTATTEILVNYVDERGQLPA